MKKVVFNCFLFFLLVLIHESAIAQYDLDHPSKVIRVEDGLPNHSMRGMVQDAFGFMWIGSFDGLSQFDGKKIQVFRHKAGDSSSLTQNSVLSLAADPNNGQVWVGTFSGLNVYQPTTGHFRTYTHDDQDSTSLPSNYVSWLYVDRQSTSWVGSRSNILSRLDDNQESFIQYEPKPIKTEDPERIRAIEQDQSNDSIIWIGTNGRLFSFHKYNTTFDYDYPSFSSIQQIHSHSDGYLYIREESGQIILYEPQSRKILQRIDPMGEWRFGRMFQKSADELWINCNQGIALLNTKDQALSYPWRDDPAKEKEYEIDMIDRQGRIWSTSTAGLEVFDPATTQFSNYIYETTGASAPFITQRLLEGPEREAIFLNASSGNGVHRFDLKTKEWLHIQAPEGYAGRLFYGIDLALLETGKLLILDRHGIYTLSADGQSMIPHPVSQKLPPEQNWLNMFVDSKGYIWLGGLNTGVLKINSRTWEVTSMTEWLPSCRQPRFRWTFYEDSHENIWVTVCGGMAFYSYQEDSFHFLLDENNPENTFKSPKDFVEDLGRYPLGK